MSGLWVGRSVVCGVLAVASCLVQAADIPLTWPPFTPDPEDWISFHPDGSVTMREEATFGTLLTNAPPFDAQVIFASRRSVLSFEYELLYGAMDVDDVFTAAVLADGLAIGDPFYFETSSPGNGRVGFDLTPLAGAEHLGLEFALLGGDGISGSQVRIANVRSMQVPLPATLLLLGAGGLGLVLRRRTGCLASPARAH